MKIPELTDALIHAYESYRQTTEKKEAIMKHLNPLLDKLLFEMKITLSDENIENSRCQDPTKRIITDKNKLYLASEEDAGKFYKASHEVYIKEGYDVKMGYCPILIAKSKEVKAENIFIDESMYLVKGTNLNREELNSSLHARSEYIKLTLDLIKKQIQIE